jgi:NAD(P)-dependent dehydrogenase (short-subunit alcohol dehydrogenase family)
VPLSFGAPGFAMHSLAFEPTDLDVDLSGRRMVITGATSGLGFAAARALAARGAELVLLCRDAKRGADAAHRISAETGSTRLSVVLADLASLESVAVAASELRRRPVDALIHNAGLLPSERIETADGLELTFATHVAAPFLLTMMLRSALRDAPTGARVVWVSSGGMYARRLNLDDPQWTARKYDGVVAYAETKRAQVVLAELWAEELATDGVTVSSMHPGWADTPGVASSIPRFRAITRGFLRTPDQGADTIVWLAASDAAARVGGGFFFDRRARLTHWLPSTRESEPERRALWQLCETLAEPFR